MSVLRRAVAIIAVAGFVLSIGVQPLLNRGLPVLHARMGVPSRNDN